MESFNLINLNASVDNSATFAASSASSTSLNEDMSEQAQRFQAANELTFNDHLTQSIESNNVKFEEPIDEKTRALIEQLMRLLKNEQQSKSSREDSNAIEEAQELVSGDNLEGSDNILAKLEDIIASLSPSKSKLLSNSLAEIKALNGESNGELHRDKLTKLMEQSELNLERQLDKLQAPNQELTDIASMNEFESIINDVKNLLSKLGSSQNKQVSNEELAAELTQLQARIKSLNVDDISLAGVKDNIEELVNVTSEGLSLLQDSVSQEPNAQKAQQSDEKIVQKMTVSGGEEVLSDKLQTLITELPEQQRQQLFNFTSEKHEQVVVNTQSAKQMLAQIEGSRQSLQQQINPNADLAGELDQSNASSELSMKGNEMDRVGTGRDNSIARAASESEKQINVRTASVTSEREFVKGDVVIEQDKPVTSKVDALVAQLESSFRNSSASTTPAETSIGGAAARVEQQVAKEFASSQLTANKAPETLAQRVTLNDNSMASQQLKEHMTMMARGGINHVVLNLDPEELGAMSVRIVMQQDQMNVQFQVSNPQAKDMLEQAMAKLKESLQEQGIELNQSDVKEQNQQQKESQQAQQSNLFGEQGEFDDEGIEPVTLVLNKQSTNGIDYYA
ncbi:flagellar hook-length control protein FliK [Psychrobium sp. nBUS_13]|uniref:flagellar hook-length control protein FliK n=1 Tax=Psychrobium sp. nBUS_13 TaxID=3395319 RepID=UPI003EBD6B53